MIARMATPASKTAAGSVGTFDTQFLDLPNPVELDCGRTLHPIRIAYETDYFVEICSSGNYRLALSLIRAVKARGIYHRVLIGTDTPGGTGVIPRGILREIAFMSSVGEVAPETVICMATGNVGRAHGLDIGILEEGRPADLVLLHKITGSVATDALDSFAKGDLPGISTVIIDGEIRVAGRSQQTPPPERVASETGY